ncbi:uncharacterized protein TRAVEDRAFT_124042 [Trametes versicolor FP-101664 SS1]|uniref:uncharacterized protein n=1 Tax=Trametes versicolor (strain FP-101664) TaxID=717944 RepID=UPI00046234FE|nr:uncharacterized protein TRAVEDRAFT_124042 [Trametes versicolor FP-101664 SS1]EIW58488.1 hypothetical protein TRAVEDRAFT_124042 [Trametes versicolor FP-101664 SS1]
MPVNIVNLPDQSLPPPVVQDDHQSGGRRSRSKKNARIDGGLRVHWDRFVRKLGSGTAPSTSSNFEESVGESSGYPRSRLGHHTYSEPQEDRVDEVVVDREWSDEIKSSSITHSEHGGSPEKTGSNHHGGTNTDRDSFAIRPEGFWGLCRPLILLRWRLWPATYSFFCTHFMDEKSEMHYNKENWFLRKNLALWSSGFLIVNWAFGLGFVQRDPLLLSDKIFLYAIASVASFVIPPMVIFDWPRDRNTIYQITLVFSIWIWSVYQVIFIYLCGQYNPARSRFTCNGKDYLTMFYYTSALQTIALFGLKLHRFPAMLGALVFFILSCVLIVPDKKFFVRNLANFLFFQGFLLYIHYMRENAERRLYTLRDQLKVQFRATQKAQVNERKAADSKRRLTSCVRVPLNTALLAVQNMQASGMITQDIEFKALEGSLSMMSKVLNDVLDFNRMDSGRFESVLKPYKFHQVLRSLFVPLQLATDARGLQFVIDLDNTIDEVARRALFEAMGEPDEAITRKLHENPDEFGIVVGDETRLRQIITNLASNACKFTPAGGKLTITTKLVIPEPPSKTERDDDFDEERLDHSEDFLSPHGPRVASNGNGQVSDDIPPLSATHLTQHNVLHSKPAPPLEWIVVRIEVTDTGCGIRPKDMVQSKLFSAFNQTEQGRLQGGKGTGLGLALVRQIVKLSGGRLGVQSKVGEGSTFWVEIPLGVGNKALPALTSPMDMEEDDYPSPRQAVYSNLKDVAFKGVPREGTSNVRSSFQSNNQSHSSSALHSIMEQGGLVEISTKPTEGPLTRTIGDPNTGTEARFTGDDITPPNERPTLSVEHSSDTARGLHLSHMPKPQSFGVDGVLISPALSAGTTNTLPSQAGSSGSAAGTPGSLQMPLESKLNVLVVDDDLLTRKLMSRMLTRIGCKVTTAENGEVALDLILHGHAQRETPSSEDTGCGGLSIDGVASGSADEYRYQVVFLDNQMPVMSGLEAVSKLRQMGRRDFVVGVTGNALLADQQEYLEAGVDHVLTKPVLEKSLKSMLVIADERRRRGPPASPDQPSHPPS